MIWLGRAPNGRCEGDTLIENITEQSALARKRCAPNIGSAIEKYLATQGDMISYWDIQYFSTDY